MTHALRTGLIALVGALILVAPTGHADATPDPSRGEVTVERPRAPIVKRHRTTPLGVRAARLARNFVGAPYTWGGASPSGFDCSGLVYYVYGRLGIDLPHNAAAQFEYGRPVPLEQLKPGDLVFFSSLGHVGLALGDGRYIHAPQSGERVEVASLASRAGSIVGARRLRA